jgi:conserved domain protein
MIKISDNTEITLSEINHPVINELTNKSLSTLEQERFIIFPPLLKDSDDLDEGNYIFRTFNGKTMTCNIVGFLSDGNNEIHIHSRFFETEDEDYFLDYMLQKVLHYNVTVNEIASSEETTYYDLLVYLFPYYLEEAMRKGLYKEYASHSYNDSNVRGQMDINRHFKENVPFVGKVAYNTREFSFDNKINQLIRHTIEKIEITKPFLLEESSVVQKNVKMIKEITQSYSHYELEKVLYENISNTIKHGFFEEYTQLQTLCLKILTDERISYGASSQKVHGIVIDIAWLWEEYLNLMIKEHFYHPQNKLGAMAHYYFQNGNGKIYPDFIGRDVTNRVIADAKYKPEKNIKSSDYSQILSYMFRFDSKLAYFLHPTKEESQKIFYLMEGVSMEQTPQKRNDIRVEKIGMKIPRATSYSEFVELMEESEKSFLTKLKR